MSRAAVIMAFAKNSKIHTIIIEIKESFNFLVEHVELRTWLVREKLTSEKN